MDDEFASPVLQRLARSLGTGLQPTGPRRFDLVFDDDLVVQVCHERDADPLAADIWCHDACRLAGPARRRVVDALLRLNHAALHGPGWFLGLDGRDFIVLHARARADAMDCEGFLSWLGDLLAQARRVRDLVRLLGLDGVPLPGADDRPEDAPCP